MVLMLDNPKTRQKIDANDMLGLVERFEDQCREGERLAREVKLPSMKKIQNVVICGMGGSAIGGDLLKSYIANLTSVPVEVVRNYGLPNYANAKTLVIASSYSGNTEETLTAYQEAQKRQSSIFAITTGGKLAAACKRDGYASLTIPGGLSPRAATGYSFMPLLVLFERWGWIPDQAKAIQNLYRELAKSIRKHGFDRPTAQNPAKRLAMQLHKTLPVIYAGQDSFAPVAARWRCQLNENAKHFAHDSVVPEMNHNEILGWNQPAPQLKKTHVVYLMDTGYHPQTKKRFSIMKKIIRKYALGITEVKSSGKELLARMFSVISFGDFVSVYLAYLNKEDPTPIPAIDYLKKQLE